MINKKSYKVIVIGSGPGGSVAGSMIAEKGHSVLILEKGLNKTLEDFNAFSSNEMLNKYKNGGLTLSLGKTNINYVEGMCVGGGSEVNSGLYHRLPPEVLEKWEQKNHLSFDKSLLNQCYKKNEEDLSISFLKGEPPMASKKLIAGCAKLNWSCEEIPRWFKYDSFGGGVKQSMTKTYIPKFLNNGGELIHETTVHRIKKNGDFYEIHTFSKGKKTIFKSEYVFVCAGAIDSPQILHKSGYRNGIGNGLKTHPSFKFTALFDEEVYSEQEDVSVHQIKEFSPKISMGSSVSNKAYIGLGLNENENLSEYSHWKKMANFYTMISPEGSGRVVSLPFTSSPLVFHKLTQNDYHNLHNGIFLLAKVLFESGVKKLFPSCYGVKSLNSLEDLYKIRLVRNKNLKLMTIHLFCSNQMAGKKNLGPLSPEGFLWEDEKIYVADSSILIDSPTVNPQGIIMAIARINTMKFLSKLDNEI